MRYFKVTNKFEKHGDIQYNTGIIEDLKGDYEADIHDVSTGIFFGEATNILRFILHGIWVREVHILPDSYVASGKRMLNVEYKAKKIKFGKRRPLWSASTANFLKTAGADIHTGNDYYLYNAVGKRKYKLVEYLLKNDSKVNPYILQWAISNKDTQMIKLLNLYV